MADKGQSIAEVVRRHRKVAASAVYGLVVGSGLVLLFYYQQESEVQPTVADDILSESVEDMLILPPSEPVRLRIPAISIETDFEGRLGLNDDQTIAVPKSYTKVGWYEYGPMPGQLGPAVVLGHVDSYQGPAIFYKLGQLKPGDYVFIDREDQSVATFVVERLERHAQSGFPTAEVYGDLPYAGLRLITCTGTFDHGKQVYSHNLIVFARLVESATSETTDI